MVAMLTHETTDYTENNERSGMKRFATKIKVFLGIGLLCSAFAAPLATPTAVYADTRSEAKNAVNSIGGNQNTTNLDTFIKRVINILLFVVGAIAVIVIIVGGIRYVLSAGDSSQVTAAKNTVLYAIVGLIVAIMAYAIVNFVVDKL